ncbi:MAG: DUF4233 domain-containing protein [Nesterenkonia sp.]|uniref:DUF4233 domain-containing protein n=1 Tax=Nesterenkonia marinintestina TaxID=2979865 RepID=UPI0021C23D93|nr:DUF4233 domain-containing protein [Nesterenkonia sp. GX14115]MDO5492031.1 DUF4233 domain-containing protein [Nesterenkonia sp.]
MARQTRAQRAWRPGQVRPPRSVKVLFASTVLCLEALLMFFYALMVWGLHQHEWFAWWLFGGSLGVAALLVVTCGLLRTRLGWLMGWVLQFVIIAGGIFEPLMFVIGAIFLGCWWFAVVKGRQLDVEKHERFLAEQRLAHEAEASSPPEPGTQGPRSSDGAETSENDPEERTP